MLIKTTNLCKIYGNKTVIDHLNIEVDKGQLLAYIGTNGAGKSTTIKMLTGLLKPTSGQIELAPDLRIGMVFQESIMDTELTVWDNLKSRAALYSKNDKAWLDRLIGLLDLNSILKQAYGTLSGGQRRRVDIARALINRPNLLFLDEPTTGLDVQTRQAIWNLLRRLQVEEGLTIFLTTHYLEEAEHADLAYIIDHGKVLAQGSAQELKAQYAQDRLWVKTDQPAAFDQIGHEVLADGELNFRALNVPQALEILSEHRSVITDFAYHKGDINDVYLNITGTRFAQEENA
ncbi:ABC transporter ATP-binding protein [Streptococcus rifensis]